MLIKTLWEFFPTGTFVRVVTGRYHDKQKTFYRHYLSWIEALGLKESSWFGNPDSAFIRVVFAQQFQLLAKHVIWYHTAPEASPYGTDISSVILYKKFNPGDSGPRFWRTKYRRQEPPTPIWPLKVCLNQNVHYYMRLDWWPDCPHYPGRYYLKRSVTIFEIKTGELDHQQLNLWDPVDFEWFSSRAPDRIDTAVFTSAGHYRSEHRVFPTEDPKPTFRQPAPTGFLNERALGHQFHTSGLSDPEDLYATTVRRLESRASELPKTFDQCMFSDQAILFDDVVAFYQQFDGLYVDFAIKYPLLALVIEAIVPDSTELHALEREASPPPPPT